MTAQATSASQYRELHTPRLIMRNWCDADLPIMAQLNADAEVMRYFPATLTREQSDSMVHHWQQQFALQGWGNWAVEIKRSGELIGFVGLSVPRRALPFMPCVEIGWRLRRAFWGQGLASEAAQFALRFGFTELGLEEIVSFTSLLNMRSRAVMQGLGMRNAEQDFDHPALADGHLLQRHCLYRLSNRDWQTIQQAAQA